VATVRALARVASAFIWAAAIMVVVLLVVLALSGRAPAT
jgi:hypothetical protein